MIRAGIDSDKINTIFFTHLHADHGLGLSDVLANDFFRQEGGPHWVDIYGPPETKKLVDYAFRYLSVGFEPFAAEGWPLPIRQIHGSFPDRFRTHEFRHDGAVFQDDEIRVSVAENSHYALMPSRYRQRLKSYSLRIETPHGVVVFTGDTGPSEAVVRLARGADVLVSEATYRDPAALDQFVSAQATRLRWTRDQAGSFRAHFQTQHLDSAEVGQIASKARAKAVVLYHYSPADTADKAAYVAGVRKYFPGPVFSPDELDSFCMSGQLGSPSGIQPCGRRR